MIKKTEAIEKKLEKIADRLILLKGEMKHRVATMEKMDKIILSNMSEQIKILENFLKSVRRFNEKHNNSRT